MEGPSLLLDRGQAAHQLSISVRQLDLMGAAGRTPRGFASRSSVSLASRDCAGGLIALVGAAGNKSRAVDANREGGAGRGKRQVRWSKLMRYVPREKGLDEQQRSGTPRARFSRLRTWARELCVSEAWVRDHVTGRRSPALPVVRLGGRKAVLRFRRADIDRFLELHTHNSGGLIVSPQPIFGGICGIAISAGASRNVVAAQKVVWPLFRLCHGKRDEVRKHRASYWAASLNFASGRLRKSFAQSSSAKPER